MERNWVEVDNLLLPLIVTAGCWFAAVWGWKAHLALMPIGAGFVVYGGIVFLIMPKVVNDDSGQFGVGFCHRCRWWVYFGWTLPYGVWTSLHGN